MEKCRKMCENFEKEHGRRPRILVAKMVLYTQSWRAGKEEIAEVRDIFLTTSRARTVTIAELKLSPLDLRTWASM